MRVVLVQGQQLAEIGTGRVEDCRFQPGAIENQVAIVLGNAALLVNAAEMQVLADKVRAYDATKGVQKFDEIGVQF